MENIVASLISGCSSAILFNWFDKGQYNAIKHNRSFFLSQNFKNPFQGTVNSMGTKVISNGLYFYWIDTFRDKFKPHLSQTQTEFVAGNMSGIMCSLVTQPISAVKYRNWDKNKTTGQIVRSMWQEGGWKPFVKGVESRMMRDMLFSSIYVMSHYYGKQLLGDTPLLFLTDNMSVIMATTLSSPFNYLMNKQYASKPYHPYPNVLNIISELRKQNHSNFRLFNIFHVGIGNIRIALGITISHRIYDYSKQEIKNISDDYYR